MNVQTMIDVFKDKFPQSGPPVAAAAPGRVNLIGEHTDYNDGFVLPMAINDQIILIGSLRSDRQVHLYSMDFEEASVFSLDAIEASADTPWSNYIRGICVMYQKTTRLQGMNIVLQGRVPQGAGLSSSAALEVAAALLVKTLHGIRISSTALVKLAQSAENEFVGVQCGIMDQFVSMLGKQDHVLFLDCRSLDYELVPAPFSGTRVIVVDSGVKRGLVDSEYNKRRAQCSDAVDLLRDSLPDIQSLRDVELKHLPLINSLPNELAKRARHVVTENARVLQAVNHLRREDITSFGELMNQSHISLRDDYEVSCRELDLLVDMAWSIPGTLGSRMTGAGFGGCTVSLVEESASDAFTTQIKTHYKENCGISPRVFVYQASKGAHILPLA